MPNTDKNAQDHTEEMAHKSSSIPAIFIGCAFYSLSICADYID
jgi:hypothetical protein